MISLGFRRERVSTTRKPKVEVSNEEKIMVSNIAKMKTREVANEMIEELVEDTFEDIVDDVIEEVIEHQAEIKEEQIEEVVEQIEIIPFESLGEYNESELRIYCIQTEEIFNNNQEVADKYGISKSSVTRCCRGSLKKAGKVVVNGEELNAVWRYVL